MNIPIVGFSQIWLAALLRAAWQGGIALLVVWITCQIWPRLPARVKCWLWRLAYAKLLIGLVWATPVNLHVLRPEHAVAASRASRSISNEAAATGDLRREGPGLLRTTDPKSATTEVSTSITTDVHAPIARPAMRNLLPPILLGLWLFGIVVLTLRIVRHWRKVRRLRRISKPIEDSSILRVYRGLLGRFVIRDRTAGMPALRRFPFSIQRLGFRVSPSPLLHCDSITSPLLLGVIRPAIVIPTHLLDAPPAQLRLMLAHELAHLARRDLAWNWLALVTETLFFFHPLVWLGRRQWRLSQEMAADQAALAATAAPAIEYGEALLSVASALPARRLLLAAGVADSRKSLERRILAMKHLPTWSRRRLLIASASLLIVALATIPPWRLAARAQEVRRQGESPRRELVRPGIPTTRPTARPSGPPIDVQFGGGSAVWVQSHADGVVSGVSQKSGAFVHKGDVLFTLDDRRAQLAVEEAQINLERASVELQRKQNMQKTHVIGDLELKDAELAVQMAKVQLKAKELDLEDTRVTAPTTGVVRSIQFGPGAQVTRGANMARIEDLTNLQARSEPVTLKEPPRQGESLDVHAEAFPGVTLRGKVVTVSRVGGAPQQEHDYRIILTVDNPEDLRLEGTHGKATLLRIEDQGN